MIRKNGELRVRCETVDDVVCAAQMALTLEASALLKPGNVDPIHDFSDTRYEHFLASAIAIGPATRKAAERACEAVRVGSSLESVALGELTAEAVTYSKSWHRGGNTTFGAFLLLLPLAAGAGAIMATHSSRKVSRLRHWTLKACKATRVIDAIRFYQALKLARPGGLDAIAPPNVPDALDPQAEDRLQAMGLTLFNVMAKCMALDCICREWASGMPVIFTEAYPAVFTGYEKSGSLRDAAAHCFLTILATHEDTLIKRKIGSTAAAEVSRRAQLAAKKGGHFTKSGVEEIMELDRYLRQNGNELNPGVTADITAAGLFVGLLAGLTP
ncbi:MAG: triphosphoribosyl-dephospho-CoA synthase [Candidatus Bathyarchaeia archaeon]